MFAVNSLKFTLIAGKKNKTQETGMEFIFFQKLWNMEVFANNLN